MSKVLFENKSEVKSKIIISLLTSKNKKYLNAIDLEEGKYLTVETNGTALILVNVGEEKNESEVGYHIAKAILELKLGDVALDLSLTSSALAEVAFAIQERTWGFYKYKSKPKVTLDTLEVITNNVKECEKIYERYAALISGINLCKELSVEPSNVIYPETFAKKCLELKKHKVEVKVLGKKDLQKLKMNSILAVSQGSSKEPKVVVMQYMGDPKSKNVISFVGKGVCFDSGGLFIKDQVWMPKMKYDKSGAAAVTGAMLSIAMQKLKVNIVAVIGLVENMPDGNAQKPSDVIVSMSGKTIEVADPDAEGRLVLADCLYYVTSKYKPRSVMTLATLTGDTVACLSYAYAGLFSKDSKLVNNIKKAGEELGDAVWHLPMGKVFKKQIESDIADVKNIGVVNGGDNAAAAEFLSEFVGETPYAHLDIAGMVWRDEETLEKAKGATGYGVKLLEVLSRSYI